MVKEDCFTQENEDSCLLWLSSWRRQFPWLAAGITTRVGGISKAPYHSSNMAFHVGDNQEDVIQNRNMLTHSLGVSLADWVSANQTHSKNVHYVTKKDAGKGSRALETALEDVDALYTDQRGLLLATFYADCVPIYVVDPTHQVVGLVHAGWRGTVAEIGSALIAALQLRFQSRLEDILVAIGPSIDACCYEVNEQVMSYVRPLIGNAGKDVAREKANGKYDLDLKRLNQELFIKAGISPENIEVSRWCTSCHNQLFFSHRKEKGITGRMVSFITIL